MFENFGDQLYTALIANDRWKMYLQGLGITLMISVGAIIIGLLLGALVGMTKVNMEQRRVKRWYHKVNNAICNIYLTVIRGTPMVIQLLIAVNILFAFLPISYNIYVAIISFGINSGAYVAEIIRAGILAVEPGQTEAGRSLGLPQNKTMRLIVMPQAIKNILPAIGNELIVLIKETAVVVFVAVQDLTKAAEFIQSRTYQPIVPLLLSAVIYLVLVMMLTWLLGKFEKRLSRSDAR